MIALATASSTDRVHRIVAATVGILICAAPVAWSADPHAGAADAYRSRQSRSPHPAGAAVAPRHIPEAGIGSPGCLTCHGDIEVVTQNMGFELSCTFCHGGDPRAVEKDQAHVQPTLPPIMDNTVAPRDYDLPYQRFVNPSNLRVAMSTCGECHPLKVESVIKGMMATAAGHYAGGLYQSGVVDTQTPIYGTFRAEDFDGYVPFENGAVERLIGLITYDPNADPNLFSTHFAAVPAQACARCHLWSRGKGYRGAVGADGTYRADGCAACHMLYANDGRSQSADMMIDHEEQGHPMHHIITRAIPTEQCLHCHHRGARIGLSFTGRAQMPPRLPSGPGVPGTTDVLFNGNYHYADPETNPRDIHRERGLHCIDCHTKAAIMGDQNIWGHMDQATKIECRMCHGMPDHGGTLIDHDNLPLTNVTQTPEGDVVLTSKVDGVQHPVTQIMNIVDPLSPVFNPRAACSMNDNHLKAEGGLECYACHSYWTPNCFGCHFERDERLVGVNLVTRQREIGKVRTNNKVFESLKHFFLGPNSESRIAPYIVSCHPIADVTAPDGSKILDFVMPTTVNGKSGLGINPVNPHTVRGRDQVRTCAECHRSPPALGLGSGNYALARDYAYATSEEGLLIFDRRTDPQNPALVGTIPVSSAHAVASALDTIQGVADYLYVAAGPDGLLVYDVRGDFPAVPVTAVENINAVDVARAARYLYVVVQGVGVNIYDNANPQEAVLVTSVPIPGAVRAVPWGIHLFVAAGDAGLVVVDISDHTAPAVVGSVNTIHAVDVRLYAHFQNSRRFAARAYVADPDFGVRVLDLLPDFAQPLVVGQIPLVGAAGLDTYTAYVAADDTTPSREHDYLYVAAGASGLHIYDITNPDAIQEVAALTDLGGSALDVDVASEMAPPGVDDYALVASGQAGLQLIDVTDPGNPQWLTTLDAAGAARVLVDVQPMDRFVDEQGKQLKENSHPGVGVLTREDIVRILSVDIAADCLTPGDFDGDWDVDAIDFAHFSACVTGPDEIASPACAGADADSDADVDLADFAAFQRNFTGF